MNNIKSILEHYDSKTIDELTKKISSIKSLKDIETPSITNEKKEYRSDLENRYFKADFDYGIQILISIAKTIGIKNQTMEKVYNWYLSMHIKDTNSLIDLGTINILNLYR